MASQSTDDADDEQETYSAVTWLESNNADTQTMLLGAFDDGEEISVPETDDGIPVRARRYYEPKATIDLPEPMGPDAAVDWVNDNRDHEGFEGYDWDAHDRREYLDTIVANRYSARQTLAHFEERLQSLTVVGVEAKDGAAPAADAGGVDDAE